MDLGRFLHKSTEDLLLKDANPNFRIPSLKSFLPAVVRWRQQTRIGVKATSVIIHQQQHTLTHFLSATMVKAQVLLTAALVGTASAFNAAPMKMSAATTVS